MSVTTFGFGHPWRCKSDQATNDIGVSWSHSPHLTRDFRTNSFRHIWHQVLTNFGTRPDRFHVTWARSSTMSMVYYGFGRLRRCKCMYICMPPMTLVFHGPTHPISLGTFGPTTLNTSGTGA